ncbi:MAG: hypothetical protein IT282_10675 [Bacteroidetes bacterium]|nr:hypothetical protein [Bacteroidota bacterium]
MSEDIIQEIWDRGKSMKGDLSVRQIEEALHPHVRRQSFNALMYVWIWLAILAGTLVFDAVNLVGYSGNPGMLMRQIGVTMVTVVFGIYGIHLLHEIRSIDRGDESLVTTLQRLLRLYRTKFEIWNFMMAATIVLLTWAVTSYVDNDGGYYRINQVNVFVAFTVLQFAFMYAILKIGQHPFRKEMKILMSDLEGNMLEGSQTIATLRKRWRIWAIVFVVIGIILLLFGIWQTIDVLPA